MRLRYRSNVCLYVLKIFSWKFKAQVAEEGHKLEKKKTENKQNKQTNKTTITTTTNQFINGVISCGSKSNLPTYLNNH